MSEPSEAREHRHEFTEGLYGWITHTELASAEPSATREWCASVLGWDFMPSFPAPDGEYHLYRYSDQGGGGIRSVATEAEAGSTPFVHVEDTDASFAKAIEEGATEILAPTKMMEGVRLAIVRAPGGVPIGFSGPT